MTAQLRPFNSEKNNTEIACVRELMGSSKVVVRVVHPTWTNSSCEMASSMTVEPPWFFGPNKMRVVE